MKEYDAIESAYNNGYEKGWNDAIEKLADRVKRYYSNLKGDTVGVSVGYYISVIAEELKKTEKD